MDVMGRFVVVILCSICLVFVPLSERVAVQQEELEEYLIARTVRFYQSIVSQGKITKQEYEEYQNLFASLQGRYSFELMLMRNYVDPAETVAAEGNVLGAETEAAAETVLGMEEVFLFAAEDGAAHTHTVDCYAGHNHTLAGCAYHVHTGSSSYGGGCYTKPVYSTQYQYHYHSDSCLSTYQSSGYTNLPGSVNGGKCDTCGSSIWTAQHSHPCPYCHGELGVLVVQSCGCGYQVLSGSVGTHRHPPYACGRTDGEIIGSVSVLTGYERTCGRVDGWQCQQQGTDTAVCSRILCEIRACEPVQKLASGEALNTEVIACWLDGSETIERAESSKEEKEGSYAVWLSLAARCDSARTGAYGTKTCVVQVERESSQKQCDYGHRYDAEEPTCPKCAQIPTGLAVMLLQQQYAQGEELKLQLFVEYQDGHRMETAEWSTNFDSHTAGEQLAEIYCQGLSTKVLVEVGDSGNHCPYCGEEMESWDSSCLVCYQTPVELVAAGSAKYGEDPVLEVKVIFRDGHYQMITQGYRVSGYQPYVLGEQQITVEYAGLACVAVVEVTAADSEENPDSGDIGESGGEGSSGGTGGESGGGDGSFGGDDGDETGTIGGEGDEKPGEDTEGEEEMSEWMEDAAETAMFQRVSQSELEQELEENGEFQMGEKIFLTFFLKKCDVFPISLVLYSERIFVQETLFYTIGGAA